MHHWWNTGRFQVSFFVIFVDYGWYLNINIFFRCECGEGFDGPRCEITSISMDGEGYAWYPSLKVCNDSNLQIEFMTAKRNGLLFYNGPIYQSTVTGL